MARSRRSLPTSQLLAGLATVALSVAIAVMTAWPIYGNAQSVVAAGTATVIGVGAVVLGWLLSWRWWQTTALVFGLYLLAVVPVAIPSALSSPERILTGVGTGVLDIVMGWKRLLTIEVPTGDFQSVLVPYFFTVTLCTFLATALIVYGGRWAPFAVAPLLLMPLFGSYLGTSAVSPDFTLGPVSVPAPTQTMLAVAAIGVSAIWLIARARMARSHALKEARTRTGSTRLGTTSGALAVRRQALALVMLAVTAGAVLFAAPWASAFGEREVIRDRIDPLLMLQRQASPLSSYREWFGLELYDQTLFSVSAPDSVDRLRIATLNAYDGNSFHVDGADETVRFSRQPQTQSGEITITIGPAFTGVWVPFASADAGAPHFTGDRAAALADSYYASKALDAGVIVEGQGADAVAGLRNGDAYSVSARPAADLEAFMGASGGDSRIDEDAYPALVSWVDSQEVGRSGEALVELIDRLRERGYVSHSLRDGPDSNAWLSDLAARTSFEFQGSRSGHNTARIEELFESLLEQQGRAGATAAPEHLVAAVGDDEQFAPAAALIARHLGFDSRVVIGVRLGETGADLAVEPCLDTCTGANVTAWVEVRPLNGQWVPLDTTPQFTMPPSLIEQGQMLPENPTEPHQVPAEVIDPPTILSETTGESTDDTIVEDPPWLDNYLHIILTVVAVVVGILLLLVPLLVFPVAKLLSRRWRRRAAVPEVAIVAAWAELMDTYVDAGIEVPLGLTRAETADVLERPGAVAVASIVDRAVFAEHPPTREAAQALWQMLDEERRAVRAQTPFLRRLRAVFTPSSLMRTLRAQRSDQIITLRRKDRHD